MAAQLMATNGPSAAGAAGVERAGHQLLAGAGFAGDQHRGLGVGHLADNLEDLLHLVRRADDGAKIAAVSQFALQTPDSPPPAR